MSSNSSIVNCLFMRTFTSQTLTASLLDQRYYIQLQP